MSELSQGFLRIQREFENLPEGGKIVLTKQNSQPVATTQYQWEPSLSRGASTPLKAIREIVTPEINEEKV